MKDAMSEIRRDNLERLRDLVRTEYEKQAQNTGVRFTDKIFCEHIGITGSVLSQLRNAAIKPYFNELYARKIEQHLDLKLGWFDVDRNNHNVNAITINYQQFEKALLAYHAFMSSGEVSINSEAKRQHIIKNLFKHVHAQTDAYQDEITVSDFYEFMKD